MSVAGGTATLPAGLGRPDGDLLGGFGRPGEGTADGRIARAWRAARAVSGAARRVAAARRALAQRAPVGGAIASAAHLRARAFAFSRLASELCSVHGYRAAIAGPVPQGPAILVANHLSYIDPLVLSSLVPCIPLAKAEVAGWPVVGRLGRAHGVVFVCRGSATSGAAGLLSARRALASGVSVLNFPEGTTSSGDGVLPFRRGVFGLARRLRVPVVPIALSFDDAALCWTGDALFLPHYLRTAAGGGGVVQVRFGYPMTPERYGSAEDLAGEARAIVLHMMRVGS